MAFKENCPDVRNTKVIDIYNALKEYGVNIEIYDPWANPEISDKEYHVSVSNILPSKKFNAVILAVAHDKFQSINISKLLEEESVIYDVKGMLPSDLSDGRL